MRRCCVQCNNAEWEKKLCIVHNLYVAGNAALFVAEGQLLPARLPVLPARPPQPNNRSPDRPPARLLDAWDRGLSRP